MNVTRPNYFQGRARGRSRVKQNSDINFFQVVREGSRHCRKSGKAVNDSKSTTSCETLKNTNSPLQSGTAGSTFSRPKTADKLSNTATGIDTLTTHLGYDGPSVLEILCGQQSAVSSNSTPFQDVNRAQNRNRQSPELINVESGFQNIFYSPTSPSCLAPDSEFFQTNDYFDPSIDRSNRHFPSEINFLSNEQNARDENFGVQFSNQNYEQFLQDSTQEENNVFNDNFCVNFIDLNNNSDNINFFNNQPNSNFFNNVEDNTLNYNQMFELNNEDDNREGILKRLRTDLRESFQEQSKSQRKIDFGNPDGNHHLMTFSSDTSPDFPIAGISSEEVTPCIGNQVENPDSVFRQPLPPRCFKKRKISSSRSGTGNPGSFHTPEIANRVPTPFNFADNVPRTPQSGRRPMSTDGDCAELRTPVPTPRRLAGLFATPPSAFSSLPRATDCFLTPSIDTTPITTRDETSTSVSHSARTAATKKVTSTEPDSYYIIAITEGRGTAVGEVGLACIDIMCPSIHLCQISDSQTYMKTLTKINIYNPAELIVPDTFLTVHYTSDLFKAVTQRFENVKVVTVKRVHFNDQNGFDLVKQLILPELLSVEITIQKKYYALSAVSALLKYVECQHNVVLSKSSIWVEFHCAKGVAYIDLETARRLELVTGNTSGKMADRCCLLAVVNKCRTLGGKRRLRTSILQPPSHQSVVTDKQEAIDFLVHDPLLLNALQNIFTKLSDVEKLLWLCKKPPNFKKEQKTCENLTNFILLLKKTIEELPSLRDLLGDAQQDFFIKFRESLSDERLNVMKDIILKTINEDAKPARGYSASEMQRCFSIKEKVNDLLDVARITYSNLIELVQEEVDKLAETHGLPLKMTQTHDRGFHIMFSSPKNQLFIEDTLPSTFIQIRIKGNSLRFTTKEIYCLNARISRTLQEIQLISNAILYEMVLELREHVGYLYRLCENIAELDVLCSLAETSSIPGYVKPLFGSDLHLSSARHPILDMLHPTKPLPNSVYASKTRNMSIVTGPNMSGKTIYVTMIPLIQIMAQLGCYVPAVKAEVRITNHIAVRKGDIDNMGNGISSFAHEVKEFLYIQQSMSNRSLIIADEIFQGTNAEEGVAMAWAYAEELLTMPAYIFISTHYQYLTNLANIFSNVSNYHLEVIERSSDSADDYGRLTYTHRVLPGPTNVNFYGLRLIRNANLPDNLKQEIFDISNQLKHEQATALPVANRIDPEKLVQFKKIDKLEAFMKNLYELLQTDHFTLEIAEGLQRMAVEELLSSDEEASDHEDPPARDENETESRRKLKGNNIAINTDRRSDSNEKQHGLNMNCSGNVNREVDLSVDNSNLRLNSRNTDNENVRNPLQSPVTNPVRFNSDLNAENTQWNEISIASQRDVENTKNPLNKSREENEYDKLKKNNFFEASRSTLNLGISEMNYAQNSSTNSKDQISSSYNLNSHNKCNYPRISSNLLSNDYYDANLNNISADQLINEFHDEGMNSLCNNNVSDITHASLIRLRNLNHQGRVDKIDVINQEVLDLSFTRSNCALRSNENMFNESSIVPGRAPQNQRYLDHSNQASPMLSGKQVNLSTSCRREQIDNSQSYYTPSPRMLNPNVTSPILHSRMNPIFSNSTFLDYNSRVVYESNNGSNQDRYCIQESQINQYPHYRMEPFNDLNYDNNRNEPSNSLNFQSPRYIVQNYSDTGINQDYENLQSSLNEYSPNIINCAIRRTPQL